MRRLALLLTGGAVWLFLLAIPVFADGGVHVAITNSGTGTYTTGTGLSNGILTSDNCAGCHRAHTAQANDITISDAPALCLTCHGSSTTGATTNVVDGVQYTAAAAGSMARGGAILGALRAGGFVNARIDSSDPGRVTYPRNSSGTWVASFTTNVPVRATGAPVTSKHMGISALALKTVWGNGPISATASAGASMTLNCTSCHNPHGNGQYRILNPIPTDEATGGTFVVTNSSGVSVSDGTLPTGTLIGQNVRNYTIMQTNAGTNGVNTLLTVADVVNGRYSATSGDYFRRYVPWYRGETYSTPGVAGGTWTIADVTNIGGRADNPTDLTTGSYPTGQTFSSQLSGWCAQCHSRYHATSALFPPPQQTPSGDATFKYRHGTLRTGCQVCHVAHGSNALMPGTNVQAQTNPDGSVPAQLVAGNADSRLLKIDNRGTCQACHDPTGTVPSGKTNPSITTGDAVGTYSGPAVPYYPAP